LHEPSVFRRGPPPARGELHDLRASVLWIRHASDVSAGFEVVDHEHHALLRHPRSARELREPRAGTAIDVEEHGRMAGPDVGIPALLERGDQLRGQDPVGLEEQPGKIDLAHGSSFIGTTAWSTNLTIAVR
jgi:hypothetical protein